MTLMGTFKGLMIVAGAMVFTLAGAYIHSAYFGKPWLSYGNMPFPITGTAYPGDKVLLELIRCNRTNEPQQLRSTSALIPEDKTLAAISLEDVSVTVQPGCSPLTHRMNIVPLGTPSGYYRYAGVATVKGLMVDHKVPWNSELIFIAAPPKQPLDKPEP